MAEKIWKYVYVDTVKESEPYYDEGVGETTTSRTAEHLPDWNVVLKYTDGLCYIFTDKIIKNLELVIKGVGL